MTSRRSSAWQKATALVPLALLSGAWTASLAVTSATAADTARPTLPDGSTVPSRPVKNPANISAPGEVAPAVPTGSEQKLIRSASTNGIPAAALAAYQRAAQVIDEADPSCNLDWPLIAAIGRVESNHGRYGGNVLTAEGVARPGIYGPALNGSNGTRAVPDTDAGQYDHDTTYDRAVGPMQFIPSTWAVVGVDGDGDGKRNPQDIDDAALATAVYLCSGNEDLSTQSGQESAVYRYNRSNDYVRLVLSILRAYSKGDYSAVPNKSTGTTTFTPSHGDSVFKGGARGDQPPKHSGPTKGLGQGGGTAGSGSSGSGGSSGSSGGSGTPAPSPAPTPAPPGTGSGGSSGGGGDVGGDVGGTVGGVIGGVTGGGSGGSSGSGGDGGSGGGGGSGDAGSSLTNAQQCLLDIVGDPDAALSSLTPAQLLDYQKCVG